MLRCVAAKSSRHLYERENRMSVHEPTPFRAAIPSVEADRALKFGVGVAVAPLWATFFTAAGAGMAYWWMSSAWTRRQPKSFAPAKVSALPALRAPVLAAEPALRRPEPEPAVEARPALRAPEAVTLAAATSAPAELEPVVEPAEIAAVVVEAKPALVASHMNGARAEALATPARKPPVRRKTEPKA
jgi:hypothetical protein